MNYRHAFHAGNFADVFKHVLLTRLLVYLTRKETPLRYIDTHAGIGLYDTGGTEAARTGEWRDGIGRIVDASWSPGVAGLLQPYLSVVRALGQGDGKACYPGSPLVAAGLLRRTDRLLLYELHPQDSGVLAKRFARDRRAKVIGIDGYVGLGAAVPPPERRGLVLIDPPFESRDEFDRMAVALRTAHSKWSTGVYALWYPLKYPSVVERFCDGLVRDAIPRILRLELWTRTLQSDGPLTGCGLLVVNPTHRFDEEARDLLPELCERLATGAGASWSARWIAPERPLP